MKVIQAYTVFQAAAINAHISYLTAAREGTLIADAEEFALNHKLASYTVIVTDENGTRILPYFRV